MIRFLNRSNEGHAPARAAVVAGHYLGTWPDPRTSCEAYAVLLPGYVGQVGYATVGRPEAQKCGAWYGSVEDVATGRCEVTRWQVLNLSRLWLHPCVQPGGGHHAPGRGVPGFTDRRGVFRSTLASDTLREVAQRVRLDYLLARPPCFLEEPYQLRWLLSYCDTSRHRGTTYQAAGFELYRKAGGPSHTIDTYRLPLAPLTPEEDAQVREASRTNPRAQQYRATRAQTCLAL